MKIYYNRLFFSFNFSSFFLYLNGTNQGEQEGEKTTINNSDYNSFEEKIKNNQGTKQEAKLEENIWKEIKKLIEKNKETPSVELTAIIKEILEKYKEEVNINDEFKENIEIFLGANLIKQKEDLSKESKKILIKKIENQKDDSKKNIEESLFFKTKLWIKLNEEYVLGAILFLSLMSFLLLVFKKQKCQETKKQMENSPGVIYDPNM